MTVEAQKKFEVEIVYNGVTRSLQVQPEERVTALLQRAIATFRITQQPHRLSLFRQDGNSVPEDQSVEGAGLTPGEVLLLRQNVVKGGGVLRLASGVIGATFRTLRRCGRGKRECVVFWTGPAGDNFVDGIEHPLHSRHSFGYEVNDGWLTKFWQSLAGAHRSIKAQVHTHPGRAFHSAVDDEWPVVSQVGFLSIVIPDFAVGDPSLDKVWAGSLQWDGTWRQVTLSEAVVA